MTNEMTKKQEQELANLDGFDSFTSETEGEASSAGSSGAVIQGTKLGFTLMCTWDPPIEADLIAVDVGRYVQKLSPDNQFLNEYLITLDRGEPWPDIATMNHETPRGEWRTDFNGNPVGPWQGTHAVYFVNPETMEKYTWPSPITTVGSARAVRDLTDQIKLMRRFRGAHVYPIVELSHTHMPTKYGGRERPHLNIKRWIMFGSGGGMLPAPDAPVLTGSAAEKPPTTAKAAPTKVDFLEVKRPSRSEELDDSIRY
jgi:hypothetical protein